MDEHEEHERQLQRHFELIFRTVLQMEVREKQEKLSEKHLQEDED